MGRFERSGLKMVGLKMLKPTRNLVEKNYPDTKEWYEKVGGRSISTFKEMGVDIRAKFGSDDAEKIGRQIKEWIIRFMTSGKVVAMVLEGNKAVDNVRRLVGETNPMKATPGSIRSDFSIDDVQLGNATNRPIVNVVHASGSVGEAKSEISNWFTDNELFDYKMGNEDVFYKVW